MDNNLSKLLHAEVNIRTLVSIIGAILLVALIYFGMQFWNDYQKEKDLALEIALTEKLILEEKNKERDAQLEDLKRQLEELRNKEPEVQTVNVSTPAKDLTVDLVKEWGKRVAELECTWAYTNGTPYAKGFGSATIMFLDGEIRAITSKHVLLNQGRYAPRDCIISLSSGASYTILNSGDDRFFVGIDEDWGYIRLSPDKTLNTLTQKSPKICSGVEVGDKLLILGYPGIGSQTGLTVTEGIVSGFDGNYYITSAKIDKGNSGGAAILEDKNCYLGIPSASVVGVIESLGRILKASFVID